MEIEVLSGQGAELQPGAQVKEECTRCSVNLLFFALFKKCNQFIKMKK